ncbi:hypothetical protein ACWGBX_18150 [Streptomyces sp. NPDC055037]
MAYQIGNDIVALSMAKSSVSPEVREALCAPNAHGCDSSSAATGKTPSTARPALGQKPWLRAQVVAGTALPPECRRVPPILVGNDIPGAADASRGRQQLLL